MYHNELESLVNYPLPVSLLVSESQSLFSYFSGYLPFRILIFVILVCNVFGMLLLQSISTKVKNQLMLPKLCSHQMNSDCTIREY